ncbi:putative Cilia- and flagella-associated protein 58 [Blattamonas nauphoetae]|uniref:Cilia- and flagella-associated protein 58 n=1 Tax=Blattamonas nauphoetae TaxID=2049346 RepID=A0ABQ9YMF1_9EUKA|nr:putative Cilia- and flagella-associated protein 58 [Blattamonas nauphoetae]
MATEDEKFDDLVFDPLSYDVLEKDCQQTIEELKTQQELSTFLAEYEKLYKALKKGHESEMRLVQRCKILQSDKKRAIVRIQTALNVAIEDQSMIETFTKEKEALQNSLEDAKSRTVYLRELCEQLQQDIVEQAKLTNCGPELAGEYKKQLSDLQTQKANLNKEKEAVQHKTNESRKEQMDVIERNNHIRGELSALQKQIDDIGVSAGAKQKEVEVQKQRKVKLDQESKDLKHEIDEVNSMTTSLAEEIRIITQNIVDMEKQSNQKNELVEKYRHEATQIEQQKEKGEDELRREKERLIQQKNDNDAIGKDVVEVRKQTVALQAQTLDLRRQRDRLTSQLKQNEAKRAELEKERLQLRGILGEAEEKEEQVQRTIKEHKSLIETYQKKLILLNKKIVSNAQEAKKKEELKELSIMQKRFIESHIANTKLEVEAEKKEIDDLETEKQRHTLEQREQEIRLQDASKMRSEKQKMIISAQSTIDEQNAKLRQQQNLLDALQTERNVASRKLISAQEANTELQHKFVSLEQEIGQLKERIKTTDKNLLEENMTLDQIVSSAKGLRKKAIEYEAQLTVAEDTVEQQKEQIVQLLRIIQTSEAQMHREEEEEKQVMNERKVLSGQLIERDKELNGLYEKMVLQESQLQKGQVSYAEVVEKIASTKDRIIALKSQVIALQQRVSVIGAIKAEIIRVQREISEEELKIRAMEDEFNAPINAHRWRILESTDPECIDLLNRIHILQKKLIVITDEASEKQQLVKEKERVSKQLGDLIGKKEQGHTAEDLAMTLERERGILKQKEQKLKGIQEDLAQTKAEIQQFNAHIEQLNEELEDIYSDYINTMKKESFRNH